MAQGEGAGAGLFDATGCLTPAGIRAVAHARAGEAPAEVAAHLASCGRCQARALARDRPDPARAAGPREKAASPDRRIARAVLVAVAALLVALGGLATLRLASGR